MRIRVICRAKGSWYEFVFRRLSIVRSRLGQLASTGASISLSGNKVLISKPLSRRTLSILQLCAHQRSPAHRVPLSMLELEPPTEAKMSRKRLRSLKSWGALDNTDICIDQARPIMPPRIRHRHCGIMGLGCAAARSGPGQSNSSLRGAHARTAVNASSCSILVCRCSMAPDLNISDCAVSAAG